MEEQPSTVAPPTPTPKQSPRLKRWLPLPEPMGNMPLGRATLAATLEVREPSMVQVTEAQPY